jgi:tetratricopeptide (TPR) repeat protein
MPKPRRTTAHRQAAGATQSQRSRAQRRATARQKQNPEPKPQTPVALIWGGFAAAAAIVVIIVALSAGGSGSTGAEAAAGPEAITADTSGSYSELVDRANGLYDKGIEEFNKNNAEAGEQNFRNAAAVYKAAWEKQPGDPSVGTDLAVALFYSRHHDEALERIETVLTKSPDFQPAHLNKAIFLKTESQEAKEEGETGKASGFLEKAKAALEKVIAIDSGSESGQRAAELLRSL